MKPFLYPIAWAINLITIAGGILSSKNFEIWCAIELSMVLFIVTILTGQKLVVRGKILLYFSFQVLVSRVVLICIFSIHKIDIIEVICWSLMAKLGLAPSHHWFTLLSKPSEIFSNFLTLAFIFVLQKILPLCMLATNGVSLVSSTLACTVRALIGMLYFMMQQRVSGAIVGSSLTVFRFIVFGLSAGMMDLMLAIFVTYSSLTLVLIATRFKFTQYTRASSSHETKANLEKVLMLLAVLAQRGFPPSPLFIIKVAIVANFWKFYLAYRQSAGHGRGLALAALSTGALLGVRGIRIFAYFNLMYRAIFINNNETSSVFQRNMFIAPDLENLLVLAVYFFVGISTLSLLVIIWRHSLNLKHEFCKFKLQVFCWLRSINRQILFLFKKKILSEA